MEEDSQSAWPQPCSLLAQGSSGGGVERGIILLVVIPFLQYFNEQSRLQCRRGPGWGETLPAPTCITGHRHHHPYGTHVPSTASHRHCQSPAQTQLCPYVHAPTRVPNTSLSLGEHLLCALTPPHRRATQMPCTHTPSLPGCCTPTYPGQPRILVSGAS